MPKKIKVRISLVVKKNLGYMKKNPMRRVLKKYIHWKHLHTCAKITPNSKLKISNKGSTNIQPSQNIL